MDRTIMEDYYDQKYGENMEKNPWEKSPEYQELLEKQTRIEDAIRGLLGNENHRVWQLYEDAINIMEKDPACPNLLYAILLYQGFHILVF